MQAPVNCCLIPLTFLLFLLSEGIITVYYRFLADFDTVKNGTSSIFSSMSFYWAILAMLIIAFFIALVIKYYTLNIALLKAT